MRCRLLTWRVSPGWYAIAVLTAPIVYIEALVPLSLTSPAFLSAVLTASDRLSFVLVGTAQDFWWASWRSSAGPASLYRN
jgi:hypothetical protein